jgi:hypothetical protein
VFDDLTDEPDPRGDGPAWVPLLVTVVSLIWFGATLWAVILTLLDAWDRAAVDFFGGSGNVSAVRERALVALWIATGPPAVGLVVALLIQRRRLAAILAVVTGLGLLGGLCLYVVAT